MEVREDYPLFSLYKSMSQLYIMIICSLINKYMYLLGVFKIVKWFFLLLSSLILPFLLLFVIFFLFFISSSLIRSLQYVHSISVIKTSACNCFLFWVLFHYFQSLLVKIWFILNCLLYFWLMQWVWNLFLLLNF